MRAGSFFSIGNVMKMLSLAGILALSSSACKSPSLRENPRASRVQQATPNPNAGTEWKCKTRDAISPDEIAKLKTEAEYYQSMDNIGAMPPPNDPMHATFAANFHAKLHAVVAPPDYTRFNYGCVWEILRYADEDPESKDSVIALYTRDTYGKNLLASGSSTDAAWNREHVWAKSHGFPEESQYAHTDAHHLRPANVAVNNRRGNHYFGELVDEEQNEDTSYCRRCELNTAKKAFEPAHSDKGDVARMILYMDVRYEGGGDGETPNLVVKPALETADNDKSPVFENLCALLEWHIQDCVDSHERQINERVYHWQKNRNPFIDRPEWARIIWGKSCPNVKTTRSCSPSGTKESDVKGTWSGVPNDSAQNYVVMNDASLWRKAVGSSDWCKVAEGVDRFIPVVDYSTDRTIVGEIVRNANGTESRELLIDRATEAAPLGFANACQGVKFEAKAADFKPLSNNSLLNGEGVGGETAGGESQGGGGGQSSGNQGGNQGGGQGSGSSSQGGSPEGWTISALGEGQTELTLPIPDDNQATTSARSVRLSEGKLEFLDEAGTTVFTVANATRFVLVPCFGKGGGFNSSIAFVEIKVGDKYQTVKQPGNFAKEAKIDKDNDLGAFLNANKSQICKKRA